MIATDLRQAEEYAAYMRAIGWQAEKGMFIRRLPLVPWRFIKIQRQKRNNFTPGRPFRRQTFPLIALGEV